MGFGHEKLAQWVSGNDTDSDTDSDTDENREQHDGQPSVPGDAGLYASQQSVEAKGGRT